MQASFRGIIFTRFSCKIRDIPLLYKLLQQLLHFFRVLQKKQDLHVVFHLKRVILQAEPISNI